LPFTTLVIFPVF